ncbi:hypothetical protein F2Q68_00041598 [Brassica cretica]|uniref:Uncharacterized protein n=1 Tax=Brassica cretica TaxID=69181 RepID=A0A8S9MHC0_BRACR|nr:hypothetical protein F2Q68_00041598 [Brassica cretica]
MSQTRNRKEHGSSLCSSDSYHKSSQITKELDKGKGHVFSYNDPSNMHQGGASTQIHSMLLIQRNEKSDEEVESSGPMLSICTAPVVLTDFQLGPFSEVRVTGNMGTSKAQRKQPPSWKIRAAGKNMKVSPASSSPNILEQPMLMESRLSYDLRENYNQKFFIVRRLSLIVKKTFPEVFWCKTSM